MKPGDFTGLGEKYRKYRVGYSDEALNLLIYHTGVGNKQDAVFADVGAGTGIWTKQVAQKGIKTIAVEPNDDMRRNGVITTEGLDVEWKKGTGEETGLLSSSADWISMASSFHWTDPKKSLPEFHRVLKKGGHLTLIWNPLLKEGDKVQEKVEQLIKQIVPEFSRGSRAGDDFTKILTSTGHFKDVMEIRTIHYVRRTVEEYIDTWRAVNHLQAVAGAERFEKILNEMRSLLKDYKYIDVPYLTKSWTATRID